MQNCKTLKTLVVLLTLWLNSLAAEKNIILRALTATSDDNIRKTRDVSGPSILVTPKPSCPSVIACPYPPYPKPTTKRPTPTMTVAQYFRPGSHLMDEDSTPISETENITEQPVGESEQRNVQGPSVPATTKPPCPGYITCPYPPYPRPTTKPPLTETVTTSSLSTAPEKLIVEYIGPEKEDTTEKVPSVSELNSKSEMIDSVNKPGNAQGPSVSATSKPPCPSYITCPYPPYPRPTTKSPQEESATKPSANTGSVPDKLIVDYFVPEKEDTPETAPTVSETNSKPDESDSVNKPGNAQGPSISATSKPPCPSYISCPYPPYPRPTTKPPKEESVTKPSASTSSEPEKLIVDYFVPEKEDTPEKSPSASETNPKPDTSDSVNSKPDASDSVNKPGNVQGPSISATTKPPCPGYITCPYPPYPRPTTKPSQEGSVTKPSTTSSSVPDKLIVDYFVPEKEDTTEKSPSASETNPKPEVIDNVNKPGNAQGPSISATSKPPCPSYISCPYPSYPRPTTKPPQEESVTKPSATTVPDKLIVDYFFPEKENVPEKIPSVSESNSKPDVSDNVNKPGNAQGPSISATSKPPCPSYITCPYPPYPRPTTKPPQEESATKPSATTDSVPDKLIVDYIVPEKENTPEITPSVSESNPKPDISYSINRPGNVQGPSISATSKPPCPGYITCPYPPYPRPTTKAPYLDERPTSLQLKSLDKAVVDYIVPDSTALPEDLQSIGESSPSPTTTTADSEDDASVSLESNAIVPVIINYDSESEQSSHIMSVTASVDNFSSTKKPEVESIESASETNKQSLTTESPVEWNFPGLSSSNINSVPPSSESISQSQDHNLPEYQSDALYLSRGPAISATQRPRCSFYAPCPYEYPRPTTASPYISNRFSFSSASSLNGALSPSNNPLLHTNPSNVDPFFSGNGSPMHPSPQDPVVLGNQGAFLPIYSYVYGIDPYAQNAYYYNRRPVLITQQPFWPSYLKNPWIYPRPLGSEYAEDSDSSISESNEDISSDVEEEDQKDDNENASVV